MLRELETQQRETKILLFLVWWLRFKDKRPIKTRLDESLNYVV